MKLSEELLKIIEEYSGLYLNEAHKSYLEVYVQKKINQLEISQEEFCSKIRSDSEELTKLINEATINETYFFREEAQFDFLKKYFLSHKKCVIWSAACSTGEEPYSILALAKECSCAVKIIASDIDTYAVSKLKNGCYTKNSFRTDGEKFHNLIEKIGTKKENSFEIKKEYIPQIQADYFNLNLSTNYPEENSIDIIFLRNVFIYFNSETRKKILTKMFNSLTDDGIIILSTNEIASINNSEIENLYEKENCNSVYYLKKSKAKNLEETAKKEIFQKEECVQIQQETIEELFKIINTKINLNELDKAKNTIEKYSFSAQDICLKYYLLGTIAEKEKETKKAINFYERSIHNNKKLWPAYFKLYYNLRKANENENQLEIIKECSSILEEYRNSGNSCYNFMIESFSLEYFFELCKKLLTEEIN